MYLARCSAPTQKRWPRWRYTDRNSNPIPTKPNKRLAMRPDHSFFANRVDDVRPLHIAIARLERALRRLREYVALTKPRALYRTHSARLAHAACRYSITYLVLRFAALLVDHYA